MNKAPKNQNAKTDRLVKSNRRIKTPDYQSFKLSKRIKHPKSELRGGFRLLRASLRSLYSQKRLFLSLVAILFVLNVLLVYGFTPDNSLTETKELFDSTLDTFSGRFTTGLALFAVLVGSDNINQTESAGFYQGILMVIFSLAFIWAIRQTLTGQNKKIRIRDPLYKGMYPLIPFLGVIAVIGLQLIPLAAASFLYTTVIVGGLAITSLETVLWLMLIGLLVLLSIYMITSSTFALYIVTLSDFGPLEALRSARELVRYRRFTILRKLLVLPFCLLIVSAMVLVPLIMASPVLAQWTFYLLSSAGLLVTHSYFYSLYRELL